MKPAKVSFKEYIVFAEAWLHLAIARLLVVMLPFKYLHSFIGKPQVVSDDSEVFTMQREESAIGKAIKRASTRCFWRTKCLEQAVAASNMLRLRGKHYLFYLGVSVGTEDWRSFYSHAWTVCDGQIITGGVNVSFFKVITKLQG
jgi:hypothetical protein